MAKDYIEREAAIDAAIEAHNIIDNNPCQNIRGCINAIPTADVVPVRHGKWVKATGMMPPEYCGLHICSECGHYAGRTPPYGGREMLSDYCHNCGARMDKGGDGE